MASFKKKNKCDRLVLVWCGSTEKYQVATAVHQSLAAFEKLRDRVFDDITLVAGVHRLAQVLEDLVLAFDVIFFSILGQSYCNRAQRAQ